jgi:hypothetical protein
MIRLHNKHRQAAAPFFDIFTPKLFVGRLLHIL